LSIPGARNPVKPPRRPPGCLSGPRRSAAKPRFHPQAIPKRAHFLSLRAQSPRRAYRGCGRQPPPLQDCA